MILKLLKKPIQPEQEFVQIIQYPFAEMWPNSTIKIDTVRP